MSNIDNILKLARLFEIQVKESSDRLSDQTRFNPTDLLNAAKEIAEELNSHIIEKIIVGHKLDDGESRRLKTALQFMSKEKRNAIKKHLPVHAEMALLSGRMDLKTKIILDNWKQGINPWKEIVEKLENDKVFID